MTTGTYVALIGTAVSVLGWTMIDTRLGAAVTGFGLAHVVLGVLDAMFARLSIRAVSAIADNQ